MTNTDFRPFTIAPGREAFAASLVRAGTAERLARAREALAEARSRRERTLAADAVAAWERLQQAEVPILGTEAAP